MMIFLLKCSRLLIQLIPLINLTPFDTLKYFRGGIFLKKCLVSNFYKVMTFPALFSVQNR